MPVHDLALDGEGQPLLAMKLVRGKPWDRIIAADFSRMPPDAFLAIHLPILVSVAQAVAFAHSRGVVHRDLKPSQAMVGEFGEVLLMDWGLAIVFDNDLLRTALGNAEIARLPTPATAVNPAGTPAFMAPEQTEKTAENVGPWTDIYILGGTLYYLLTGALPHQGRDAHEVFFRAGENITAPPRLAAPGRAIPPELDRLAMDCMHSDPAQRVPSAQEFIHRLQDHLTGEGHRRESLAVFDEVRRRFLQSEGSYSEYGELVARLGRAHTLWPANPDIPALRGEILAQYAHAALAHGNLAIARLQAERLDDGDVRRSIIEEADERGRQMAQRERARKYALALTAAVLVAFVLFSVWFVWRTDRLRRASDFDRDRATNLRAIAVMERDEAYRSRLEAEAQRDSANEARLEAEAQRDLARSARSESDRLVQFMISDLRKRLQPVDPELRALDEVAVRALEYYERQSRAELDVAEYAGVAQGLLDVGGLPSQQGNSRDSARAFLSSAEVARLRLPFDDTSGTWHVRRAAALNSYARVLGVLGRSDDAERSFLESAALLDTRTSATATTEWLRERAASLLGLGQLDLERGGSVRARDHFQEARRTLHDALMKDFKSTETLRALSVSMGLMADTLVEEDPKRALREYAGSNHTLQMIAKRDGSGARIDFDLAVSHGRVGLMHQRLRDFPSALSEFQNGQRLLKRVVAENPADLTVAKALSASHTSVGELLARMDDDDGALFEFHASRRILEAPTARDPRNMSWRRGLAINHSRVGDLFASQGKHAEAETEIRQALDLFKDPAHEDGGAAWVRERVQLQTPLARLARFQKHLADARTIVDAALVEARQAEAREPGSLREVFAHVLRVSAEIHSVAGEPARGMEDLRLAVDAGFNGLKALQEDPSL